ncbi:hypothetical protein CKM354_001288100 [Cercospora kikuchii]|uniref:Uncharacterized protein n=1 Tax=Cercospora kikuchii TaxID=84275 RepID=A0A9P3FMT4_9PEZI|nr:uncharacterized protein CKM354_001288100 [Cercospora kikuchii]GIZ49863.1 hypothetical protein CKM354_001288100 [Cercospora kikuchii]
MKLATLFSCFLATLSLAKPTKIWFSDSHNGNATQLAICFAELDKNLEKDHQATNYPGYRCGDYWLQFGGEPHKIAEWNDYYMYKQCEKELYEAISASREWFHCHVKIGWTSGMVACSPFGWKACEEKRPVDHAPCKIVEKEEQVGI